MTKKFKRGSGPELNINDSISKVIIIIDIDHGDHVRIQMIVMMVKVRLTPVL